LRILRSGDRGIVVDSAIQQSGECDRLSQRIASQLQDAGTSTAANYHAACRARSRAAFIAKLSIVVEEADESLYWLTRLQNTGLGSGDAAESLRQEASELVAIFVASQRTATRR
jgi:four helix bundle protein